MPVVLVASIFPLAEHRDDVIAVLRSTIEQVHGEQGCELYALHEAPDRLVVIEKWESSEALAQHREGAALAALGSSLAGKLAGAPEVITMQPVPAGNAAQGEI